MDKSVVKTFALPLVLLSSAAWSHQLDENFRASADKIPEWEVLSSSEMNSTSGEFVQFTVPAVVAISAGAIGNAGANAINQYETNGSVNLGEVALAGVAGAALAGVNVAAVASGSATAIVLAAGLDVVATVGGAIGAEATSAKDYTPCLLYTSPSPRDLSTSRMPSSA